MIRNYLGFTRGVAGAELAHRAWEQAVLFGAEFIFSEPAGRLAARGANRVITFPDQTEVVARAVLVTVGISSTSHSRKNARHAARLVSSVRRGRALPEMGNR